MRKSGTFAERLREYLVQKGMYQKELVDKVNQVGGHLVAPQLTMYLKGSNFPREELLNCMSKAMEVSVPWLLGYDIPQESEKILDLFASLTKENQEAALGLMTALKAKQDVFGVQ